MTQHARRFDVVGLGFAAVDVVIVVDALPTWEAPGKAYDFQIGGGGPAATATFAAARLGCSVGFVGTHGNDEFGQKKRNDLIAAGVDAARMIQRNQPEDQIIIVYVERSSGERIFVPVASIEATNGDPHTQPTSIRESELDKEYIQAAGILHIDGCHPEAAMAAARWVHEAGGSVMLDGGKTRGSISEAARALVAESDYLVCGAGFASALTGISDKAEAVRVIAETGPQVVVETAGAEGSYTATRAETFHTPAYPVEVVDTTGAGDVFHGAFLAGLVKKWPIQVICQFAAAASAISCTRLGGRAGCPTLDEVHSFLADRDAKLPEDS